MKNLTNSALSYGAIATLASLPAAYLHYGLPSYLRGGIGGGCRPIRLVCHSIGFIEGLSHSLMGPLGTAWNS